YQTDVSSIYAIGDIIPTVQLAHAASGEGEIAVSHMAGKSVPPELDPTLIPSAVYTEPQVASFGYKLQEALDAGYKAEKGSFPYRGAGKAVAVEKSGGFVTVVRDSATGEILGASAAGAEATELIHELLLARRSELLTEDISEMVHAHPTLSEAVMEAARAAEGWAVHI
ncbi:MAG: dihydrolipoyl dehydrogenase, partial [Spirochaetales bacterium]|nr:dihydrolipoyl dehydrogenase [Spirochaetales bacterium]MCF7939944.1 dihydrolipoyl dehydrogenase [Spirochaetales bacterium]